MRLAAQLRALSEIHALDLRCEPQLRQTARHRILLHPKGRDGPGVDHIRTRDLHHDGLAHGHDHGGVGGQQEFLVGIARLLQLCRDIRRQAVFARTDHEAVKAKTFVDILVAPIPLIPGRLDDDVTLRDALLLEQHRDGERTDDHQNDDRDDRPRHLDGGVVGEGLWRRVALGSKGEGRIGQQGRHKDGDHRDDDEDKIVQPVNVARQLGDGRLKAGAFGDGLADDLQIAQRVVDGGLRPSCTCRGKGGKCPENRR